MIPIQATHVSAVVLSEFDGTYKMLLLDRVKGGYWCHVAGGVESGEEGWQTILRELKEETQIDALELHSADFLEQFYEAKKNRIMVVPCFVIFCKPNQNVILNHEHTDFRWCSLEEAKHLAPFANQHRLYEHVWAHYIEQAPSQFTRINIADV
ncbi:NUDIX domain-containing protein [Vibrio alfacsensis]|uniref:NUDIX domain-containing protein n=1 Tax=Vibrio alfacsensis TaxID=1074311 RepID=A0ABM6YYC2_9VIBR|nr:NUDIX domain-containing protein [Vibrio alfacsensis]AXY02924.1 NUDIX domain-containing protein [Vibrio alfacsensis]